MKQRREKKHSQKTTSTSRRMTLMSHSQCKATTSTDKHDWIQSVEENDSSRPEASHNKGPFSCIKILRDRVSLRPWQTWIWSNHSDCVHNKPEQPRIFGKLSLLCALFWIKIYALKHQIEPLPCCISQRSCPNPDPKTRVGIQKIIQ